MFIRENLYLSQKSAKWISRRKVSEPCPKDTQNNRNLVLSQEYKMKAKVQGYKKKKSGLEYHWSGLKILETDHEWNQTSF
jgi:hypothetical protein